MSNILKLDEHINKNPLYEQIADTIEQAIIEQGSLAERLPSEMDLAKEFGVSRTIIREALKILKARGLVDVRVGGGAYITKPEASDVSKLILRIVHIDRIKDEEVYAIRLILETAAIREAARRVTPLELEKLAEQVDSMEKNMYNLDVRIEKDCEFHCMIGRLSGNELLALLVESMTGVLKKFIIDGIRVSGGNEDGIYRHRLILDALHTGDPDFAENVMRDHLVHSWENVLNQRALESLATDGEPVMPQ